MVALGATVQGEAYVVDADTRLRPRRGCQLFTVLRRCFTLKPQVSDQTAVDALAVGVGIANVPGLALASTQWVDFVVLEIKSIEVEAAARACHRHISNAVDHVALITCQTAVYMASVSILRTSVAGCL
jgi:hypothetical protein